MITIKFRKVFIFVVDAAAFVVVCLFCFVLFLFCYCCFVSKGFFDLYRIKKIGCFLVHLMTQLACCACTPAPR